MQDDGAKNNYHLLLMERKQQQKQEHSTLLINLGLNCTNNGMKSSMNELDDEHGRFVVLTTVTTTANIDHKQQELTLDNDETEQKKN